jgi:hypothetical protein
MDLARYLVDAVVLEGRSYPGGGTQGCLLPPRSGGWRDGEASSPPAAQATPQLVDPVRRALANEC